MVKPMKYLVVKMDEAMHKDFKRTVADNSEDMSSVVIGCIKNYLADKKKVMIH